MVMWKMHGMDISKRCGRIWKMYMSESIPLKRRQNGIMEDKETIFDVMCGDPFSHSGTAQYSSSALTDTGIHTISTIHRLSVAFKLIGLHIGNKSPIISPSPSGGSWRWRVVWMPITNSAKASWLKLAVPKRTLNSLA